MGFSIKNKPVKIPKTGSRLFSYFSAKVHKHWFLKSATLGNSFRFLRILEILSKKGKESCSRTSGAGSATEAYLQPGTTFQATIPNPDLNKELWGLTQAKIKTFKISDRK